MPCYHPMIRIEDTDKWEISLTGKRYHPAKIEYPHDLYNRLEELRNNIKYRYQVIPCGQCIGCRLEYSREWANRGYLESKQWEQNWFCTITYDEDHLTIKDEIKTSDGKIFKNDGTWNGTLVPEELTQFIKNLRQIMKREYDQDNIRFMACGEYGSEGERPHYHIIFFNLNLPTEDLYNPRIINKEVYYQSHIIERAWGGTTNDKNTVNQNCKGICNISEATWNSIAYTARYITKKITGAISEETYASKGQVPEFFRVSRNPGIGEGYYQKHKEEIYKNDEIIIKNRNGAISSKPPKYFDRLLEQEKPDLFKKIKKKREKGEKYNQKIKDDTTSLYRLAQLKIEEASQEEKNLKLRREFEKNGVL